MAIKSRRAFIKSMALAGAGITIVPRSVLGQGFTPPSDQLNVAVIGGGGKGYSDANNVFATGQARIGAIVDVDPKRAGRLRKDFPNAPFFTDFRQMFSQMQDIDAVTISTPDHTHAVIALAAMQLGKHVYLQKPLTNTIFEARTLTKAARQQRVVTQMGNQGASGDGTAQMVKWFDEGVIGKVHEVQVWTNRPVWPQGIPVPTEKLATPAGVDWENWVGPADYVDYHPLYHPFKWRGWWNFGTGALGDVGCHLMDMPYRLLGLGYPTEVEASVGAIFTRDWVPDLYPESCPPSARIELTFAKTQKNASPVRMVWHDGGLRPFHPPLIPADHPLGEDNSANGVMLMGEKGIMMSGMYGTNPKVYLNNGDILTQPKPEATIKRLPEWGHANHWVEACKAGFGSDKHAALTSGFDYAGPMTETVLMGNLAIRSYNLFEPYEDSRGRSRKRFIGRQRMKWDGDAMRITNFDPANKFVTRDYRKGWGLGKVG